MGEGIAGVVTLVEGIGTDVQTIGVAVIGVAVIVMSINWVKAQFF